MPGFSSGLCRKDLIVSCVLLSILTSFQLACVSGKGKNCMQSGIGPSDLYQNGAMNPNYMWYRVGNKIQVPVVLDHNYAYRERHVILGGLKEIQYKTCIEFYIFNHTSALEGYDYVYITKAKQGCWSHIGRVGRGQQELSLGRGCVNHRTAVHEMIHALGFAHEHVRSDRDNYVQIYWQNIQKGRENNFARRNTKSTDPYGPYDYHSVMHYDRRAFSKNRMDTIRPLKPGVKIGVRQTMSSWDTKKLLRMYKCQSGSTGGGGYYGGGGGYSNSDIDSNEIDDDEAENDVQHDDDGHSHRHERNHDGHSHRHERNHDDHHHHHPAPPPPPNQSQSQYLENNPYFFDSNYPSSRPDESPPIQSAPLLEDQNRGTRTFNYNNNHAGVFSRDFLDDFSFDF